MTSENVEEYIAQVIEAIIGEGAKLQAKAFREGFSKVFPITDLQAFAMDELVLLFGNGEEDWSIESEFLRPRCLCESVDFLTLMMFSAERGYQS